ncbi:MAG: monothiol glutaredoxin [Gammaproteobacteria bacterium]|jgi:monothiol glutaredoxin
MALNASTREQIQGYIGQSRVVLFMKGTPKQPQCGFSAATIGILDNLVPEYATVNVLEDQGVREGIKEFSEWPTIPQLYIDNEFVGGSDIVREMYNAGELHEVLGLDAPDRTPPEISISDDAAEIIRSALEGQPGMAVHLAIDATWNHNFNLGPKTGNEVVAQDNGIELLVDIGSAVRARGLRLGTTESFQGKSLNVENPNMPPAVRELSVQQLSELLGGDTSFHLFDVREPSERAQAAIPNSQLLNEETMGAIDKLSRDEMLVFHCHHGQRSQSAAEHLRSLGFTNVHNVVGGIDAWSREIDTSVPRY